MVHSLRVVGGAEAAHGSHPWLVSGKFFGHRGFAEWSFAVVFLLVCKDVCKCKIFFFAFPVVKMLVSLSVQP